MARSVAKKLARKRPGHPALGRSFHDAAPTTSEIRDEAFAETILSIPRGKVASYGQVAAAAGYPRYHRAVARFLKTGFLKTHFLKTGFLKTTIPGELPWQRVLGAGGEIKLPGRAAAEQRLRLKMEGVTFVGKRVDLRAHQYAFDVTA
jgi:methylated-DNA-protein-cysteine methyltransferase-like protein